MSSLLKEFSKGGLQADLKTSDGSAAGSQDMGTKPVDIKFSLMRNMINTDGQVSGSDVNDYLERAQDMNDEVETVGFAIETDDGDIIKIYVAATEADAFEEEMAKLLGLEGDTEEAINQLAQKFDIVDVVWPHDPEGEGEQDPDANLAIDDVDSFGTDEPADEPVADLPADGEDPDQAPAVDDEGFEDIPPADAAPEDDAAPGDDSPKAPVDDEGFEDIPPASDEEETEEDEPTVDSIAADLAGSESDAESEDDTEADTEEPEEEPVLDDDGNQKLDKDGNPVMRKKAKKPDDAPMKTEEGLKRLGRLAETARDDVAKHIKDNESRGNSGKYQIIASVRGGVSGPRSAPMKKNGEIQYFETEEAAKNEADALSKRMNRAGAKASFSYVPKLVEDKQPQHKENTMSLGSNFLSRINEVRDADAVKDGMSIPLDTPQKQLVMNLKKPLEKKIIALFSMAGVVGRLLSAEPDVEDRVRAAGENLRKNQAARTAFTKFYNALATAKGYAPTAPVVEKPAKPGKVEESAKPATPGEAKRGSALQQKFEAVMVTLGLPESLVVSTGPSQIGSFIAKTAKLINTNSQLKQLLNVLAQHLGVRGDEAPEDREDLKTESVIGRRFLARVDELSALKSSDPFVSDVLALLRLLGVPEDHLGYQTNKLRQGLLAVRDSMKSRSMVDQKIEALMAIIKANTKPAQGAEKAAATQTKGAMPSMASEGRLMEAFGELEAMVRSDRVQYNVLPPTAGPAWMASYVGVGTHADTMLFVGVDPEAEGHKTLQVKIDGPFDGDIESRYFPNDKDGYKDALAFANSLRTVNLRSGGTPKGWKD